MRWSRCTTRASHKHGLDELLATRDPQSLIRSGIITKATHSNPYGAGSVVSGFRRIQTGNPRRQWRQWTGRKTKEDATPADNVVRKRQTARHVSHKDQMKKKVRRSKTEKREKAREARPKSEKAREARPKSEKARTRKRSVDAELVARWIHLLHIHFSQVGGRPAGTSRRAR